MISICGCIINGKYEIQLLMESLEVHNPNTEYEVCIAHDDRVEDGSEEFLDELSVKYKNLKIIRNTHEDTVKHIDKILNYYQDKNLLSEILPQLKVNLEKFANKEFFDHSKSILWLSSGLLYNKAVSISSGDKLLIGPGDFGYMFRLNDLEHYINTNSRNGYFYAKPNAVYLRLTNSDFNWLKNHVNDVYDGIGHHPHYRYDSEHVFKDYMRYPPILDQFYVGDFRNNNCIKWGEYEAIDKLCIYSEECFKLGGIKTIPSFHGVHAMTRKTYDEIGGFSELYYGRAFADDSMTHHGRRYPTGGQLPIKFSFAWTLPAELDPGKGPGYSENWEEEIRLTDPYFDKHPTIPVQHSTYLHQGIVSDAEMGKIAIDNFDRTLPPIRFST